VGKKIPKVKPNFSKKKKKKKSETSEISPPVTKSLLLSLS